MSAHPDHDAEQPAGGRRRATRPGGLRRIGRFLPAPAVVGAAALVLAGAGAIVVSSTGSADPPPAARGSLQALSVTLSSGGSIGAHQGHGHGFTRRTHLVEGRDGDLVRVSRGVGRDDLQQQAELQARQRMAALQQLAQAAQDQADELRAEQWVLPLAGYRLSAGYGETSALWATTHTGQDFAAAEGTPLVAIAAGIVTKAGYDADAGWAGNLVVLELDDGTEVWYAHQSSVRVSVGDVVAPGQVIGHVGSTGNSTGPHLHLEVHPAGSDPVDPVPVLLEHGVRP